VSYRFGRFELQPEERQLLADGTAIRVTPHAFDLLVVLLERAGHLVTKEQLLALVWARVVVEENTLQVHISALRKLLGPDVIATVPGRGYRFVLDVVRPDAASATGPRHNLPNQLTSFIGREKEITHVTELLGSARLLTLTGAGGCGKTRLALRVAEGLADSYKDGCWVVELASLGDPTLIPKTVASVFAIEEQPGKDTSDRLGDWLESRDLLLVLDNAEHLLGACASLTERLLRRCNGLRVLVSSREPLGVAGERTYRVPSLSVPEPQHGAASEAALGCEAARLFIERARLHRPDLAVTIKDAAPLTSICRRLDGIALAIELAAPRVRVMSIAELSVRLDDRFDVLTSGSRTALPRHRTLRSLIDWSYDLLSEPEKAMLRHASVFAGGWTIEAAERVCTNERIERSDVLDLLTSLTDKNLVVADTHDEATRFGLLETVRQYAQDRLREGSEANPVRARHVEHFLHVAEELAAQQSDADRQAKLARLDKEHDNLRAALAWCEATASCAQSGLRLAGKLYWFWRARGHWSEGRNWVYRLLAAASGGREKDRATARTTAGVLAFVQGDYSAAEEDFNDALAIRRRLGQRRHVAVLLGNLGSVALITDNDLTQRAARGLYEEALSISRELGDRRNLGVLLYSLGALSVATDDYLAGQSFLEESLSIRREFGGLSTAETLTDLGKVKYLLGDDQGARTHLVEALAAERQFGNRPGIAKALVWLAILSHDEGDTLAARTQLREALEIAQAITDRQSMATALEAAAGLSLKSASPTEAARLWGCTQRLRDEFDSARTSFETERYERLVAAARSALQDDAAFDRAWREGQSLTLDEVIHLAMDVCDVPQR
jgi:predicted ATPase